MAPGYAPLDAFETDLIGGLSLPPDISEIDADINKISALTPDNFGNWAPSNQLPHYQQPYSPSQHSQPRHYAYNEMWNEQIHKDTSIYAQQDQ